MSRVADQILEKLKLLGNAEIAAHAQRFFKTGEGEYGQGDRFLGIRVPVVRRCVRECQGISLNDTCSLLKSEYHEARLLALLLLVARYGAAPTAGAQRTVYRAYLSHTSYINNWDLVDCSAPHIVGAYRFTRSRAPLYTLTQSKHLWERRIAVLATFYFIRQGDYADTLAISEMLLADSEDLIHKAAGWMLREVGKRDPTTEENFLLQHYKTMPRTMLRYAIEKFPEADRQAYLKGTK